MRAAVCVVLLAAAPAAAQEAGGGAKVYKQVIHGVTWIQSTRPGGLATGSGTLVDAGKRLVLTNYHVVGDNPKATVFFPEFRDGRPVPERAYYRDRAARFGIPGKVVRLEPKVDLALIQLESVPDDAVAVPVATASPEAGEPVHSIGNAGTSGALWGYVKGTVRQVYAKKWQASLGGSRIAPFEATVIETDSPTNPGDSGGPLVNDAGKLVGVTQGGVTDARAVSFFIDVSEIRRVVAPKARVAAADPDDRPAKPKPKPKADEPAATDPPTVKDDAALFGPQAVADANTALAAFAKAGTEVRVETLTALPGDWAAKPKATPAERKTLFAEYAEKRLADEKAGGSILIVCLDPKFVAAYTSPGAEKAFPAGTAQKAADAMLAAFKAKDYDKGLADALAVFQKAGAAK